MASFLERAILSVLNQNYINLEYIIIDGGSTDGSVDIIKKYEQHLAYWISENDSGQSDALNKGFRRCSGEIIAWLNSDDYYEPGTLEKVNKWFVDNPDRNMLVGGCRMFGADIRANNIQPKVVTKNTLCKYWESYFIPPQPSIFFTKHIFDKTGYLDTRLNYAMDLDLWLRMSRFEDFCCIPDILSNYEVHNESKTGSTNGFDKFRQEWKLVCSRFIKTMPIKFRSKLACGKYIFKLKYFLNYLIKILKNGLLYLLGKGVQYLKNIFGIKRIGLFSAEEK